MKDNRTIQTIRPYVQKTRKTVLQAQLLKEMAFVESLAK